MSYKITYTNNGSAYNEISPHNKRKGKKIIPLVAVIIAVLITAGWIIRSNDPLLSNDSFEALTKDIMEGEDFVEAITVFCKDIIESARTVE